MAWLPLFWLGLRVLGLQRFQGWLQRGNTPAASNLSLTEITRIATLVNMAAAPAVDSRHLPHALAAAGLAAAAPGHRHASCASACA